MFKKLFTLSLALFAISINPSIIQAVESGDAFTLDHTVESISNFEMQHFHPVLQDGDNVLGKIIVQNNTLDGFKVEIVSANDNVLINADSADGETAMDYTLRAEKLNGDIGTGINVVADWDTDIALDASSTTPVKFLDGTQITPTDVAYQFIVNIDDINSQLNMAGDYSDTITITYTDN